MVLTKKKNKVNFTEGPLFWRMFTYALPIIATSLLQLFYNTADKIIVGQFTKVGGDAIGAIGSTAFVSSLIINFLTGVGGGVGVLVSQLFGANRRGAVSRATGNSLILGLIMSAVLTVVAYATAEPLLVSLGTNEDLLPSALLYLNITYAGLFASTIYNIGSGVLRAVGDSKTPLYIGAISGAVNVLLNLFFVTVFEMTVDGVALATIISQYFSAIAVVVIFFLKKNEAYHLTRDSFRISWQMIGRMLKYGIPTGLQSCCFSLTNLLITSAVNVFPKPYISGRAISLDIDHIVSAFTAAFTHSTLNATGQNYGAGNVKRVKRIFWYGLIQSLAASLVVSLVLLIFRSQVAALFVNKNDENFAEIIKASSEWSSVMLSLYFTQGLLQAASGSVRGMGYSVTALVANLVGTVGTRLGWVFLVYPHLKTDVVPTDFKLLALLYPSSWLVTGILLSVICIIAFVRLPKQFPEVIVDDVTPLPAGTAAALAEGKLAELPGGATVALPEGESTELAESISVEATEVTVVSVESVTVSEGDEK